MIEVDFADSSRMIGYLSAAVDEKFVFRARGLAGKLSCAADQIVSISGSAEPFSGEKLPEVGTLSSTKAKLKGWLADSESTEPRDVLLWHPWGSDSRVVIAQQNGGRIDFKRTGAAPKRITVTPGKPVKPAPTLGGLLGGLLGGKRKDAAAEAKSTGPLEIVFRSGDTVDGIVESIDENGVKFTSEDTTTAFVSNNQMDSIKLSSKMTVQAFDEDEVKRFLTVPRRLKDDPPTHLFLSTSGDYLRGRLVSLDAEKIVAEVRLGVQEIPRDRVARVIWLHDRPWLDEKEENEDSDKEDDNKEKRAPPKDAGDSTCLVHTVRSNKRGVTFTPTKLVDGVLSGESDLLGECSVKIESVSSLLFGRDVGEQALALRKESWKLSLAALPKAYLESDTDGPSAGVQSPLVGKAAPEIKLQSIDDVEFVLSENRDKIIVLDFWASWCGPCIQTMPKVEAIIDEFDPRDVELVAVNLQDSVERARIAIKRMGIDGTVIMDVDGETARFYDARAIPQTVIVDRKGNVTHVFVGGGAKFLKELSEALKTVIAEEV